MPSRIYNKSHKYTKTEITQILNDFYKYTNEVPKLKHIPHLPFSKKYVLKMFGTWNSALDHAGLPLNRNPKKLLKCKKCKTEFERELKEIKKSKNQFCSSACNASYNTIGRKHSEETKRKISESLKAHRIFIKTK